MGWFADAKQNAQSAGVAPTPTRQPTDGTTQPVGQPVTQPGDTNTGQDVQALTQAYLQGKPPGTTETLQGLKAFLASKGINIEIPTHGGGQLSSDKIVLPNRQVIDLWNDVGGSNTPSWNADGYWVNGQPSSRPDMVVQEPERFSNGTLGQFTGGGEYPLASYMGEGLLAPWTTPFQQPQLNDTTDPGYHARFNLGKEGMEASAAARGTLLTGGFQKDLAQFAQDYASSEYDKIYGRRLGEYNNAYGIYRNNANDQYNRLSQYANTGYNAANALSNSGDAYGRTVAGVYNTQGQNQADTTRANQQNNNDMLGGLADIGVGLASSYDAGQAAKTAATARTAMPGTAVNLAKPPAPGMGNYADPYKGLA